MPVGLVRLEILTGHILIPTAAFFASAVVSGIVRADIEKEIRAACEPIGYYLILNGGIGQAELHSFSIVLRTLGIATDTFFIQRKILWVGMYVFRVPIHKRMRIPELVARLMALAEHPHHIVLCPLHCGL
jgi:hypothetical protein